MKSNVRKELDVLLDKLLHWRKDYLTEVTGKHDDCLIDDLKKDIDTWMSPYVSRLEQVGHITRQESDEFWKTVGESFAEFIADVQAGIIVKQKIHIDIDKLLNQFKVHKNLITGNYINHEFQVEQKIKLADIAIVLIPALAEQKNICNGECGFCKK